MKNKLELTELYLEDKLSKEERDSFEKMLLSDKELAEDLLFLQNLKKSTRIASLEDKKQLMQNLEAKITVKPKKNFKLALFALILLAILTSILIYHFTQDKQIQSTTEYESIPEMADASIPKSLENTLPDETTKDLNTNKSLPKTYSLKNSNYTNSLQVSDVILRASLEDESIAIIKNIILNLKKSNTSSARTYLEKLDKLSVEYAYWNAHILGVEGKIKEASSLFKNFAADDFNPYQEDARWYSIFFEILDAKTSAKSRKELLEAYLKLENPKFAEDAKILLNQ